MSKSIIIRFQVNQKSRWNGIDLFKVRYNTLEQCSFFDVVRADLLTVLIDLQFMTNNFMIQDDRDTNLRCCDLDANRMCFTGSLTDL